MPKNRFDDDLLKIKKTSLMKSKFKAWVRAHKHCFGLWHLGERFTEKDVSYGADGYPTEWVPSPAGWYTCVIMGDTDEKTYAYFSNPDKYMEHLADCGLSTIMSSAKWEDWPTELKEDY